MVTELEALFFERTQVPIIPVSPKNSIDKIRFLWKKNIYYDLHKNTEFEPYVMQSRRFRHNMLFSS